MADTTWCGNTDDKVYLQSGQYTSTLKTSMSVSSIENSPEGTSYNDGDTFLVGGLKNKLYNLSGQFSSTVLDSVLVSSIDNLTKGIGWDGNNTPWCGGQANKLYLQSGRFSSTLLTSRSIASIDVGIQGITHDGTGGGDTQWAGATDDKLYLQSGQFSSILKTSQSYVGIENFLTDTSWDGVNASFCGIITDKLWLVSGQFSTTTLSSQGINSIDTFISGMESNDQDGRLGAEHNTAFPLALSLVSAQEGITFPGFPITVSLSAALSISSSQESMSFVADGMVALPTLSLSTLIEGITIIAGTDVAISVLAQALGLVVGEPPPTILGAVTLMFPGVSMIKLESALSLHAPEVNVTGDIKIIVTNARTFAISEYAAMAFNSMAKFNGKYLYAKANGIYEGGGEDDDGADIVASYKTGSFDINATEVQKLRNAFLNFRSNGDIQLFTVGNEVNTRLYNITNSTADTMHERRAKFERGIRDNHFSFGISNVNGSSFEIKTAKILTEPIRKRR